MAFGPRARLRASRSNWYKISARADDAIAEIHIYDEIGCMGVTAQTFIKELMALEVGQIDLHLNTPGGDVFDGIAIYNSLRQHRAKVTVYVDSLAASIGSVIAMAGDRVVMARYSSMMIHEASGVAIGANADEMRQLADLLDRTSANIARVYADRTDTDPEDWRDRMRAETWFSDEEAVELGLADEIADDPRAGGSRARMGRTAAPPGGRNNVLVPPPRAVAEAPGAAPPGGTKSALTPPEPRGAPAPAGRSDSPGGSGAPAEPQFTFDPKVFEAAMRFAADPPVPVEEAPFQFDPDIFRAVMADKSNNAPAIAQRPKSEEPKPFEQMFDGDYFAALIREAVS